MGDLPGEMRAVGAGVRKLHGMPECTPEWASLSTRVHSAEGQSLLDALKRSSGSVQGARHAAQDGLWSYGNEPPDQTFIKLSFSGGLWRSSFHDQSEAYRRVPESRRAIAYPRRGFALRIRGANSSGHCRNLRP